MQTARPTPVDIKTYVKFGNKCRTNGHQISKVITDLMKKYIKDGDSIFN